MKRLAALVVLLLLAWAAPPTSAAPSLAATQMTVYQVSNPNASALVVLHTFHDDASVLWTFSDTLPGYTAREYHIRDMPQIPSPWAGWVTLSADSLFTASVVGFDGETPTPGGPTATNTAIPPPTATGTVAPDTATATVVPSTTWTVTPGPTQPPLCALGDIACGRAGLASSSNPTLALDGDAGTNWVPATTGTEWIGVDLGYVPTRVDVTVRWGESWATSYTIEELADNGSWFPVWGVSNGNGGVDTFAGIARGGHGVRIRTTNASSGPVQIQSFEVYDSSPAATATRTPIVSGPTSTRTATGVPTSTRTASSTPTITASASPSPSRTATASATGTAIPTASWTGTATATSTGTASPSTTATATTLPSATPSMTPTRTFTPSPAPTETPTLPSVWQNCSVSVVYTLDSIIWTIVCPTP